MRPFRAALAWCVVPFALAAQQRVDTTAWNGAPTMRLVDRAIDRRSAQLADTGLADYTARAHGYLTFLAQVGEGFPDPPRVMKTDELAVEVYWRAPDQSKQRIVGRRDTLLLPTDIQYHRDHLAIIQNNFPSVIRLGDGDEVRDVPHPLSPAGRSAYDFAIADSLAIRTNEKDIEVVMVRVRPRDERLPRAVGAVYIDRESATVVRMAFSFTRAALRDKYLEDVSVVLENCLVDGRFWLPYRQEIEIRRTGSWMDFPSRGIIRGRWEICCARTNTGMSPAVMIGPEVQIYNLAPVRLGYGANLSQRVHLCAGSHDFHHWSMPLDARPINIGDNVWIAAEAFVGPGVTIGELAVIGARSVVTRDQPARMVCVGVPCRPLKPRPDPT